jgi:hypothetical protein
VRYGVVTRNESELDWPAFDRGFYEVKDATGRAADPTAEGVNTLSCFGDNAAVSGDPDLAAVDSEGRPATADRRGFDWAAVCPTHERYREGLLEIVEDCVAVAPDLRVDDVGFPRADYCRCDRCDRLFEESEFDDRTAWRASVVTDFLRAVRERVPGRLYCGIHPDPYPGHLRSRSGVDLAALAAVVDEFVVPLYDPDYGTTYWVETIAEGFRSRLDGADFGVELYAVDVDIDALVTATRVAASATPRVYFGYDASTAVAAIRRRRAEAGSGASYGDDPQSGP